MRPIGLLALLPAAALLSGTAAPAGSRIIIEVTNLRSGQGLVRACLTTEPSAFPACKGDVVSQRLTVPASDAAQLRFKNVEPGRYAIALLHDENGNGRIDKMLMVPREGFGFSRDAKVAFGPPKFADAAFVIGSDDSRQAIRMRYVL